VRPAALPRRRIAVVMIAAVATLSGCSGFLESGASGPSGWTAGARAGSACETCVGGSLISRLTRFEYQRIVRAALGDAIADALRYDYLPADGHAGPFASNALLHVDDDGVEAYRSVAELAGAAASEEIARDPSGFLGCDASAPTAPCIAAFVDRIATVLFRRAPTDAERAPYVALFETARASGTTADGARMVVTALLQSPLFLYRLEIGVPTGDPAIVRLTGVELAARLAAFAWRGAPDDALLAAAAAGDLDTDDGLAREARRMILDRRADVTIARFHTGWLGMDELDQEPGSLPELEGLNDEMYRETGDFAVHVFREGDARLDTLLTAPYTIADDALIAIYGGTRAATGELELDPDQRAGVLTHAGFFAAHTPSPATAGIYRGRVVREAFLCQTLPNPPPIDTVIEPDPLLSPRQQLEQKTSPERCQACHVLMNPTGFLFEHYDRLGRYRTTAFEFPVDATGEVNASDIEGPLDGAVELAHALAASEEVDRCVARQWMRYALGRLDHADDAASLEAAYARYLEADRDLRELLVAIVLTDSFRHRRLPVPR
jgi:hypothetical protein